MTDGTVSESNRPREPLPQCSSAQPGANRDVRSKAPSKRRKISTSSQMGNVLRTLRTASAQGDLSAPDADLDAEPEELICPITRTMFRDPVMVVDSGHTYERSAILSHFQRNGAKDPLTGLRPEQHEGDDELGGETRCAGLAGQAPGRDAGRMGQSRALLGADRRVTSECSGHGVRCVLNCRRGGRRTTRPEQWEGVTMENGRVVKLVWQSLDLTGAVPAEIGQLTSLRMLSFCEQSADERAGGDLGSSRR